MRKVLLALNRHPHSDPLCALFLKLDSDTLNVLWSMKG
jgi:hypothetical protein